jgi:SagB-type dehydrogenase family enzyme
VTGPIPITPELSAFLHELHHETDRAKPPDWEADWTDAPLPYKLYRRQAVYPLSPEIPLTLAPRSQPVKPGLDQIGHYLWYGCGITQVVRSAPYIEPREVSAEFPGAYRRAVPSGGGLHPQEVYLYLKETDIPTGLYHYDAAHHRLVLLREGDFDDYLGEALGGRSRLSECFGAVFVSTFFWKNYFKYHAFSYRLQALDAGVLVGQLLETAERFGYSAPVHFQFLDRAINHLLGLREQEESVYAVIPLSHRPASDWFGQPRRGSFVTSRRLAGELPELIRESYIRSKNRHSLPVLIRMNEACLQESAEMFRYRRARAGVPGPRLSLPLAEGKVPDLALFSRKRFSPETEFVFRRIELPQLASLLKQAANGSRFRNDLHPAGELHLPGVSLYGAFCGVHGIADGAYRYDAMTHTLQSLRPGDHRAWLQSGMTMHNVNLFQIPLCFHAVGYSDHHTADWGARGYRIQQMEAGVLVHRLLLALFQAGMGGRPLLGFDTRTLDELYHLPFLRQTALIQIPSGPLRTRARWEGSLHR